MRESSSPAFLEHVLKLLGIPAVLGRWIPPFRFWVSLVGAFLLVQQAIAATPTLRTKAVTATYRLAHPKTIGTAFLLNRPDPANEKKRELLLVTAAHTLEKMSGDRATLMLRKRQSEGDWVALSTGIQIRREGKPTWHKHSQQDVAVLRLTLPKDVAADSLPMETLANAEDWKATPPEPGALVRCVGFPHAAQFKPSKAGFPTTRLGCIASFPFVPYRKHATFRVDYNVFEGDSGGLVYAEGFGKSAKIIGLVHAQHFLDERYKSAYQEGAIHTRLGLAIVVNSQAILETIDGLGPLGK